MQNRQKIVNFFQNNDKFPFICISLKAGGVGLNLTKANHVIHFDRWWNPASEDQATDRAYRIGQNKNVIVHKLICKGTIEDKIDNIISTKKNIAKDIISQKSKVKDIFALNTKELINFFALE